MTIKLENQLDMSCESLAVALPKGMERRNKKKRTQRMSFSSTFHDLYKLPGEELGEGSFGRVETCINIQTGREYAVKIIDKFQNSFCRKRLLKEIEIYYMCQNQQNIIQLIEYFEEDKYFYLIFEKIIGGSLLDHIHQRISFSERETRLVIGQLALAVKHLHERGIAHRDIKPDNILCLNKNSPFPVKLCDFDLCSEPIKVNGDTSPALFTPVGSFEYMAPEVVDTFIMDEYGSEDEDECISYDKKCDVWALGVIMYILLFGYAPFIGHCNTQCAWDRGGSCRKCQLSLFQNIKENAIQFPQNNGSGVSENAKDLLLHILSKDSNRRLSIDEVLTHPWIVSMNPNIKDPAIDYFSSEMNISKEKDECFLLPMEEAVIPMKICPPNISTCNLLERRRKNKSNIRFQHQDSSLLIRSIC